MANIIKAQVRFPYNTSLPRDVATNTFHFSGSASRASMATTAQGWITDFYNNLHSPGTVRISDYISQIVTRNLCETRFYDLADAIPRSPFSQVTWTLGTGSGSSSNLPAEVAIVASFRGIPQSGTPMSRRRGRIYIGPLNLVAVASGGATQDGRPATSFRQAIAYAGKAMSDASLATGGACEWAVYSPTTALAVPVAAGFVDDAFDTQRRRGEVATTRQTWTSP